MLSQLSFEDFCTLAKNESRVAVFQEIMGDTITPISAFQSLEHETSGATVLESGVLNDQEGRYSFLGFNSIAVFKSKGHQVSIERTHGIEQKNCHPLIALRSLLKEFHCAINHPMSGFSGGCVGFFSYDAVRIFEKIPDRHLKKDSLPDICFKFYRDGINFDHKTGRVIVITIVDVTEDQASSYQLALKRLSEIVEKVTGTSSRKGQTGTSKAVVENSFLLETKVDIEDSQFCELVRRAKKYITQGDAFQVVLSRCFTKPFFSSPFSIYRALRLRSPSPYMFYLDQGDYVITGASPEKLVSLQEGVIETIPIAGTRARDFSHDAAIAEELLADEKECAEHMMLVDLSRNDVGTVAEPGTVQVSELKQVKIFSHVMHMVSRVRGILKKGYDALDVLQATFPAGTLTGAPKIRAMEIIDELEGSRRGFYGGAICFIDVRGNLDSCITIRSVFLQDNLAVARAGAGIVFDSDPQKEAEETRQKIQSVLEAVTLAEEDLV